jgi:hypothetical protein
MAGVEEAAALADVIAGPIGRGRRQFRLLLLTEGASKGRPRHGTSRKPINLRARPDSGRYVVPDGHKFAPTCHSSCKIS